MAARTPAIAYELKAQVPMPRPHPFASLTPAPAPLLGGRFVCPIPDPTQREAIVEALNRLAHDWMKDGSIGREYKGGLMKVESIPSR